MPNCAVRATRLAAVLTIATTIVTTGAIDIAVSPSVAAAPATAAYTPISPERIVDTRHHLGGARLRAQHPAAFTAVPEAIADAADVVAADVTAVVANVTVVDPSGPGHVTTWATGGERPTASSLNYTSAGHTVANLVTIPVADGQISVEAHTATDLIVDVQGVYTEAATSRAGRLKLLTTPQRALDTRTTGRTLTAKSTRTVDLDRHVPADASGAVVNLTVVGTAGPGHITAYPTGDTTPTVSNLNAPRAGAVVANQAYVTLNNGRFDVYAHMGTDLIVDVAGWFTGDSAPASDDGLFVAVTPYRILDTRTGNAPAGFTKRRLVAGETMWRRPDAPGIPADDVAAIALNVTMAQTAGPGHLQVWPAGAAQPTTSTVNAMAAGHVVANHAVTAATTAGVAMYTHDYSHVIADVTGYWTGPTPEPTQFRPAQPSSGAYKFLLLDERTGEPYRWNPCKPIRYAVLTTHMTSAHHAALNGAIASIEAVTGIDFVHTRNVTSYATDSWGAVAPDGADIIVGVLPHGSALTGSDMGTGGYGFELVGGRWLPATGMAFITTATQADFTERLFTHEIGHVIGLSHSHDHTALMHGDISYSAGLSEPDVAGLRLLGAEMGCIN